MRLKSNNNIDKNAQLPEGMEFRSEIIWGKIQDQRKPKNRVWFWWYAAACAIAILCISYFSPDERITSSNELLTQINQTQNVFMPLLEKPEKEVDKLEKEFYQSARPDQEYVVEKEVNIDTIKVPKSIPGLIAKTDLSGVRLTHTPSSESKEELSPAARRLQQTLGNLNKDQVASQTFVVEKFNILNEMIKNNTQASIKGASGTSLSEILRNKNGKN